MSYLVRGTLAFDTILAHSGDFSKKICMTANGRFSGNFHVDAERFEMGGTAGNVAHNAALLGDSPFICAALGESDGQIYMERLNETGVDTSYVEFVDKKPTATCWLFTDSRNNQISAFSPGASAFAPDLPLSFDGIKYVLLNSEPYVLMHRSVKQCVSRGVPFIIDPGSSLLDLYMTASDEHFSFSDILKSAHGLILSELEHNKLEEEMKCSLLSLMKKNAFLILTKGSEGATLYHGNDIINIPAAQPGNIDEPTGCGDAFKAGLLHVMTHNGTILDGVRLGNVMASFSIECFGAQNHAPTPQQIYRRYVDLFGKWPVHSPLFDELIYKNS